MDFIHLKMAEYFQTHLGFMVAAFNTLIEWFSLLPDEIDFVPFSSRIQFMI